MNRIADRLREPNWALSCIPEIMREGADEIVALERIVEALTVARDSDLPRLVKFREWIRNKLQLREDVSDSRIYGQMHVTCSDANGYRQYIAAYKCDDKQGEIARQWVQIDQLKSALGSIGNLLATYDSAKSSDEDVVAHLIVLKVKEIIDRLEPSPTKDRP